MLDATVRESLLADTRYKEPPIQHMLLPLQRWVDNGCLSCGARRRLWRKVLKRRVTRKEKQAQTDDTRIKKISLEYTEMNVKFYTYSFKNDSILYELDNFIIINFISSIYIMCEIMSHSLSQNVIICSSLPLFRPSFAYPLLSSSTISPLLTLCFPSSSLPSSLPPMSQHSVKLLL